MVQILPHVDRGPSLGQRLAGGLSRGLQAGQEAYSKHKTGQVLQQMTGQDLSDLDPEMQKAFLVSHLQGQNEIKKQQMKEQLLEKKLGALSGIFGGQGQRQSQDMGQELSQGPEQTQRGPSQGIDPSQISDDAILQLSAIDPQLGNAARGLKDTALREKRAQNKANVENEKFNYQKSHDKETFARREASDITKPLMLELQQNRKNIPLQEQAIEDIKNAAPNVGALDYFADVTGFEPARTAEGAKLKTAIKDFFLSDLTRVGARPNQWVEQQLADALPKIGRTPEANLIVAEGMKFKVDLAKKRIEIIDDLTQMDTEKFGFVKGDVDSRASALLKPYVEQRKKQLIDDISKIKSEHKVDKGYTRMRNSETGETRDILDQHVKSASKDKWEKI